MKIYVWRVWFWKNKQELFGFFNKLDFFKNFWYNISVSNLSTKKVIWESLNVAGNSVLAEAEAIAVIEVIGHKCMMLFAMIAEESAKFLFVLPAIS